MGKLSSQKQTAIDELIRKAIGPKRAVVKLLGSRYHNKKWSNYQLYLLSDGFTAFVNLDCEPTTVHVSDKVNKLQFGRYQKAQERKERKLARKLNKEDPGAKVLSRMLTAKPPKAGRIVKYDPALPTVESNSHTEPAKEATVNA